MLPSALTLLRTSLGRKAALARPSPRSGAEVLDSEPPGPLPRTWDRSVLSALQDCSPAQPSTKPRHPPSKTRAATETPDSNWGPKGNGTLETIGVCTRMKVRFEWGCLPQWFCGGRISGPHSTRVCPPTAGAPFSMRVRLCLLTSVLSPGRGHRRGRLGRHLVPTCCSGPRPSVLALCPPCLVSGSVSGGTVACPLPVS